MSYPASILGGLWSPRVRRMLALLVMAFASLHAAPSAAQSAPAEADFQREVVAEGLDLPMEFEISEDGRVFIASKCGALYAWNIDNGTPQQTATVPNVRCVFEDGLLSVALDPNFTQNNYIYFQYTSPGSITRVSRFVVTPDNSLDESSESIVLEWVTGDEAHGHMGGSLQFDTDGNLIITTGDNKAAGGYHQPSAEGTSGNTNDLRGKVLRITSTANGSYTIPAGNLFAGDALHRPEIYGMGFRNPFRLNVDPATGCLYVGDIGPDASADSAEGPGGLDEINEICSAGNYGWPYIIGYNQPYAGFDPNNLVNDAFDNTGATNLPNAVGAIWTIRHQATMAGPVYRYDESIENAFKLPEYYDGRLIFWDFNSSRFSTIDLDSPSTPKTSEEFPLNTQGFQGAIDVELDPRTHQLYVLQWGSGCCDKEPYGGGALYRFDFVGGHSQGNNVALGGLASASTEAGGNLAAYAIDGDPLTRWESEASDPQSLTVDLQQEVPIGSISILWEGAYSSRYAIEASADGVIWIPLAEELAGSGGTRLHIIDSADSYRYVRLTGTERGTGYGHSIFEFEVYANEVDEPEELTEYAYLNMPRSLDANFTGVPLLLSETGAFSDTANLVPSENLIPFKPNTKLWSDRALKERWISIPAERQIDWHETENWSYPQGTVAVKHFELPLLGDGPGVTKRLETRLIVMQANGRVYGLTYKWRDDNSDADLLTTSVLEDIVITDDDGSTWTQTWAYPSPTECIDCHNASSAQILGLSTRQLNGEFTYPDGSTQNQLIHLNNLSLFNPGFSNANVGSFDKMVAITDTTATLETRIKSYLDTNCAHCHGTGNGGSQWDARYNTPLAEMRVVGEGTTGIRNYLNYYGIENAEVVTPGAPHESILYIRDKSEDPDDRMPPIGRALEHTDYINVLEQWIDSLDGLQPEPVLISANATATASSAEGEYVADFATDGDVNTRWSSEFDDLQTLTVDLQDVYRVDGIVLNWEAAYGSAYVIEGSVDGITWQTLYTQTVGSGGVETLSNLSGNYRYVRLSGTERGTEWGYSLWELEVYGGEPGPVASLGIVAPNDGATYAEGSHVSLNVDISDASWFAGGGSYQYQINDGSLVNVSSATAVNLGVLPVGAYQLAVQLRDSAGNAVGEAESLNFSVVPTVEAELVSRGKSVTVSSVEGDYVGNFAVDGDTTTRWSSDFEDPQWIEIDLGESFNLDRVELLWEAAYASAYLIEGSVDGVSWQTLVTETASDGGADSHTDLAGNYRFIRLTGTARATAWGYSLFEFEVWASDQVSIPGFSIDAPLAGQQYTEGDTVELSVQVADAEWFASGNGFIYSVDGGTQQSSGQASVSLGMPALGNHSVEVQLTANGSAVGEVQTLVFSIIERTTNGGELLSLNKPVITSEVEGDFLGAMAVDGDMGTRWSSAATDDEFIQVDLGASYAIGRVELEWEAAYGTGYFMEASDDGVSWSEIYRTTNGDGGLDTLEVMGQGRYVRLTGTQRATPYGYSLWEMRIYSAGDVQPIADVEFTSPANGSVFSATETVSFAVSIDDASWFSSGGSYQYRLNGAAPVNRTDSAAVNLGVLSVGAHTLEVALLDANGVVLNSTDSLSFSVIGDGETPDTPAPSKLSPVLAYATSEQGGNLASFAIDGAGAFRWESESADAQALTIDMGDSTYFTRIRLDWEAAYGRAYQIDVSDDGAVWDTVYETQNSDGGIDDIALNGEQGRYIRMFGLERATGYGYSLFEVDVYGLYAEPGIALIDVLSPANGASLSKGDSVTLQVSLTDSDWFANGGGYRYTLDGAAAVTISSDAPISLGNFATGRHSLSVTLVDNNGAAVSIPRNHTFTVSCGNDCPNVLVFSKTSGFRHGSIPAGIAMVQSIADDYGYGITASEDASLFTDATLASFDTVVFMNTTGDIFTDDQKAAFRRYIESGGGYVGTHSAADTEHSWDWYTDTLMGGAEFIHHGDGIPRARVAVEQTTDPLVSHIGSEWYLADEWYFWESSPRGVGNIEILANLDRSSYPSNYPVEDHPVIFKNTVGAGRAFYTAVGHVDANFADPNMVESIRKAIEWTSQ
ncbi:discoidin domain-containing protein [Gilvimarinus sp. SDUM040013]|uniref:Discoidin domain-containing protein n=1 Tax=Gilvimarinus gilvus TaxID=3058038 RepID=A0ABU4RY01_9GAMM|nr:discoidin domain-containing protein [Gilvimarinus sp. SDUM040013]MDO3386239.1 discoidin domain-containing protein [Gilvimarinus sp. SDUM040013]MDX6849766.1 discoidin domain-containing protein [Gilvimarinus sp. SDUM040013]